MGMIINGTRVEKPKRNGTTMNAFVNGVRVWEPTAVLTNLYQWASSPVANTNTAYNMSETTVLMRLTGGYLYNKKRNQWVSMARIAAGDAIEINTVNTWSGDTILYDGAQYGVINGISGVGVSVTIPVNFKVMTGYGFVSMSRYGNETRVGCVQGDVLLFSTSPSALSGFNVFSSGYTLQSPWYSITGASANIPATLTQAAVPLSLKILTSAVTGIAAGTTLYQSVWVGESMYVGSAPGFNTPATTSANLAIGIIS